jgi:hypothetical protein
MSLDRDIRMVTICDTDGKIMHSDHRPGVTNLLTPDESRKSLEMAVNAWKSRSQLASKIGKGKYVLVETKRSVVLQDLIIKSFSRGFLPNSWWSSFSNSITS